MWFYLLWKKYSACYIYYIKQGVPTAAGPCYQGGTIPVGPASLLHIFKTVGKWPSCMMDKVHAQHKADICQTFTAPRAIELGAPQEYQFTEHRSQRHQWADLVTDRCHVKLLSTLTHSHAYLYIRTHSLAIGHNESRCLQYLLLPKSQSF